MIALYLLILLAWSWVCYTVGEIMALHRIFDRNRQNYTDDMNALDEWATREEQRMKP
jgi:hypothetical protein